MEKCIEKLFHDLHENPEESGKEHKTKQIIRDFMDRYTSMEYHELEGGFYYVYRSKKGKRNIALRADYDALKVNENEVRHLCGHDGHSCALCYCAYMIEKQGSDNNIFFLFQSAEENGHGAKKCLSMFDEKIDEIYGQHNLPGFPFGEVFTAEDTFACASVGFTISLKGKPSHAAYPENGVSPSNVVAKILSVSEKYKTLDRMITVISVQMGKEDFGVMAHEAKVCLTLRSKTNEGLSLLKEEIRNIIEENSDGLDVSISESDYFPALINHFDSYKKIKEKLHAEDLEEPMRWSEDFAYFLLEHEGAFFGIGSGLDCPGLHTSDYVYPSDLIEKTALCFYNLIV